jgi:putative ABC transport system permease protein
LLIVGLVIGLAGALACSRVLGSFLFEVKAVDPILYAVVCILLAGAAILACWLPARRASRVDPIVTLRSE